MIENIAMKKIRLFNKKQKEYTEYELINKAQNGCDKYKLYQKIF